MKLFILGSLAFDELGHFKGRFKDLMKDAHLEKISLSFLVEKSVHSYGGCAGNMAYGLGLLKTSAHLCGAVGADFEAYRKDLNSWGINTEAVTTDASARSAHAVITTDLDAAQIAHFTPGAMSTAPDFELPAEAQAGDLILIGPENPKRVLQAAEQAKKAGLKVYFDPGQILHVFTKEDLLSLSNGVEALFVNEFEWQLFQEKTEETAAEILDRIPLVLVTLGEKGVDLLSKHETQHLEAFPAQCVDPTGAGDAFRAGFLAGTLNGKDVNACARLGTLLGAACVGSPYAQGYTLSSDQKAELQKIF